MQKNGSNEPPLSLSQQAYLLTTSLRHIIYTLTVFLIVVIGYFSFGILIDEPLLVLVMVIVIILPFLIFTLIKSRRFYRELKMWNEQYLDSSYTLIFGTTVPKGNTTGERVLYLASFIFPQLRADYIDYYYTSNFVKRLMKIRFKKSWERIINASLNVRVDKEYYVDVALETLEGFFIVKSFDDEIVTVQDLNQLIMIISDRFRNNYHQLNIFRLIVVAKDYDQSFLNRDTLEQIMNKELKTKFKIDLIVQEEVGYTVLWAS